MTREEMREKIADIFAKAEYGFPFREIIGHSRTRMLNSADAAIAIIRGETLEEAANAVGNLRWQEVDPFDGRTLGHAVVVIRALKDKP